MPTTIIANGKGTLANGAGVSTQVTYSVRETISQISLGATLDDPAGAIATGLSEYRCSIVADDPITVQQLIASPPLVLDMQDGRKAFGFLTSATEMRVNRVG